MEKPVQKIHVVTGHRQDECDDVHTGKTYVWSCYTCDKPTITEHDYPKEVVIICHVCGVDGAEKLAQSINAGISYQLPAELEQRLREEAKKQNMPAEFVIRQYIKFFVGSV